MYVFDEPAPSGTRRLVPVPRPSSVASGSDTCGLVLALLAYGMVTVQGKLIDPWHVELAEPVPPGEDAIQVRLSETADEAALSAALLTQNPSFGFLRDEPDLYP